MIFCRFVTEMEVENKLYADVHGDGQPTPGPPQYTPTPAPQQQGQSHGYPPYGPSTVVASSYYAPPSRAGYNGEYGAPPLQQQQQQQQQVVVIRPRPDHVPLSNLMPVESFAGATIYACIVFLFCNWIFGLIGFILASK